jgi:Cu-Zn family superoxide dismutase
MNARNPARAHLLMALIPCALLVACGKKEVPPAAEPPEPTVAPAAEVSPAQATLAGASGSKVTGTLTLMSMTDGVSIGGQISGLAPDSVHGFHVHETGDCSAPDAKSAGEHLNPANAMHGGPSTTARHLGDLPNVQSDASGKATISTIIAGATLHDGGANDLVGKALIVHAKPDDYATQPSGDSGDRIACGVIS